MAITISSNAATRVRKIMKKRQTPDAVLRVGVRGGGCSGLTYFMDMVDAPQPKDKVFAFEDEQVTVAVDRKSYLFINGSELDFEKTMVKTGFVFRNPLSGRSCSCGDSFTL
jgi:iron-sulfur cluster assembly protein